MVAVSISFVCRAAQLDLVNPLLLKLPSYSPASAGIEEAASFLRDLSWSLLPGFHFCEKAKMALLLALVSGINKLVNVVMPLLHPRVQYNLATHWRPSAICLPLYLFAYTCFCNFYLW